MLTTGHNEIAGVPVEVVRKRIRRINIRIAADGTVCLSVPKWWATLRQGEDFLREKWRWVLKARGEVLARAAVARLFSGCLSRRVYSATSASSTAETFEPSS